jgi:hypothetical protein
LIDIVCLSTEEVVVAIKNLQLLLFSPFGQVTDHTALFQLLTEELQVVIDLHIGLRPVSWNLLWAALSPQKLSAVDYW